MSPKFFGPIEPFAICLGTVSFGSNIDRAQSFALLDAYAEAGGNFIDTAHVYSSWEPNGEGASERSVGEWVRANGLRDRVIIATKGGHPPLDAMDHPRLSYADLDRDLNESLDRLGMDHVDLYWAHRDDAALPAGEIVEAFARLLRSGRARHWGVSNWTCERIDAANAYADAHHLPRIAASQPRWALADRVNELPPPDNTLDVDEATRRWHERTGMPMTPFTSQAKGWFGEENVAWAKGGFTGPAPRGSRYDGGGNRERLRRAIALAERKGCSAHQIALAYLMSQPFPVFPIVGTGKIEHLREALGAMNLRLTGDECVSLSQRDFVGRD
jgi:aryl-alcohol dehydrogenase-like predicted oxidoreductase